MDERLPKWVRELDIFRRIKSVLILEGNVLDIYRDGAGDFVPLNRWLRGFLRDCGYRNILFYEINHLRNLKIGSAVPRPFQRAYSAAYCRVSVGSA